MERIPSWFVVLLVVLSGLVILPFVPWIALAFWLGLYARRVHEPLTRRLGGRVGLSATLTVSLLLVIALPIAVVVTRSSSMRRCAAATEPEQGARSSSSRRKATTRPARRASQCSRPPLAPWIGCPARVIARGRSRRSSPRRRGVRDRMLVGDRHVRRARHGSDWWIERAPRRGVTLTCGASPTRSPRPGGACGLGSPARA
jgi:hypothetical protein